MLIKPLLAEMSGKLAGIVGSHNAGGQYLRQLVTPTNPNTAAQAAVRDALAFLASGWNTDVSPSQRLGWAAYGEAVPTIDPFGNPRPISGLAAYIRANVLGIQFAMTPLSNPPTVMTQTTLSGVLLIPQAGTGIVNVTFVDGDEWASDPLGRLFVFASRVVSPATNFWRGPYKFRGEVAGAMTPPTSPQAAAGLTISPSSVAGQKYFFRVIARSADGRLSAPQFSFGIAA